MAGPPDPTARLAAHVVAARYDDLPGGAVEAVKKAVLDTAGAGLAGRSAPMGELVTKMMRGRGGRADATLWADGTRLPASEAAFANAILARCRELDDVHEASPRLAMGHGGHVNVMIVPAALAVAESLDRPVGGAELIAAIAVGGDLIPRIRMAAGAAGRLGWEGPTVSPFGVAAAAGRLMGFDAETMANAMGAAYAHCSGNILSTSDGTWDVWLNAGMGARAGLTAAEMAALGHQGAKAPFLGGSGLYPLYFRGEYHEEALLSELGRVYESAYVSIKPYPACKCSHHAIHTTIELMRRHGLDAADIERIEVRTCQYSMRLVVLDTAGRVKPAPRNVNEAQFSLRFCLAVAALRGEVFADVLDERALDDPALLRLFDKVSVRATAEKDELQKSQGYPPDDVDIHMSDGRVFSGCERHVAGHPENPMSFDEVEAKFWRCVEIAGPGLDPRLDKARLADFVARVRALETDADTRDLSRLHC